MEKRACRRLRQFDSALSVIITRCFALALVSSALLADAQFAGKTPALAFVSSPLISSVSLAAFYRTRLQYEHPMIM